MASFVFAPIRVEDAIERGHAVLATEPGELARAGFGASLGRLYAMTGDFERARALATGARNAYREAGQPVIAGSLAMAEAWIEWRAGDDVAAETALRDGLDLLEGIGDRNYRATVALFLADILCGRGRDDDVRELCVLARATSDPDDLVNFVFLDAIEGGLLARSGLLAEAEQRARHAVELLRDADFFEGRSVAHQYLAEVLALAGKRDEAEVVAAEALAIREQKGDVTGAARTRGYLEAAGLEVH